MFTFNRIRSAIAQAEGRSKPLLGVSGSAELKLRLAAAPHLQRLLEEVRQEADRAKREPIPELPFKLFHLFASSGSRLEFEGPYFERRGRLLALALEAWLDTDKPDMEPLETMIWSICDEYSWSLPAHIPHILETVKESRTAPPQVVDLFASETAHALAETLYLLEDRINPWVAYRIREEIERRVFRPLFDTPYPFGWESATHNWAAVCGGAVGMAAMLLIDDKLRLAGMIDRCIRALGSFLEGYEEDGCCAEGVGYWNYGFGYYVYFADMLFEYTDGKLDLLQGDKIARIAAFPAAVAFEAPRYVNFSDCNAVYEPNTGLMSRLHSRLGQPLPPMKAVCSLHADHCYRFPHNVRNLLWTDPALLGKPAEEGSFEYPDTAWIITKHDVQGSLFAFAAKGGHNNEPHNHNDLGHFIVYAGGEAQLTDLGAGVYTRDYFREGRYTYLHNGSEGHSVPLINGKPQAAGRGYKAVVLENVQHKEQLTYKLDLTAAYPADSGLQSFIRSFEWTCSVGGIEARLRLTDDFAFSGESNDVTETFVSLQPPELEKGRIRWAGEKAEVNLHYNAGLLEANLDVIPTQDHQKNSITVYRIRLVASGLGAAAAIPIEIVCTRTLT